VLHVRLVVPPSHGPAVDDLLLDDPTICNLVRLEHASHNPVGHVVLFDTPRESANHLIARLKELDLHELGSISITRIDTLLSAHAVRAEELAPGDPGEAVIWEEVEARLGVESRLTPSFLAVMVVAVLLGAVAVLTDSLVLVVGAMVVGPEFGPLAATTLALHRRRWAAARVAATTLLLGFATATVAAVLMTLVLRAAGRIPSAYGDGNLQFTAFISHPDLFTLIVAVLAGAAGMLALTQGKSGALVGVLISVTTIPAASNIAVAVALGRWDEAGGAAAQLGANLGCMVLVGLTTLSIERRIGAGV
jgi:uncharacterized hydrophobic protein (TIGR00271 family)